MHTLAADVILGALEGTMPDKSELAFLDRVRPVGLTLFTRNIPDNGHQLPTGLCEFLTSRYGRPDRPFFIAIDQEGGRVRRLKDPFPNPGPAMNVAHDLPPSEQHESLKSWGVRVGTGLKNSGIHINFAPCADVFTSPGSEAIGDRSYSDDPNLVCSRAGAFMDGLIEGGVLTCLKHFPGQGAALADTHEDSCETTSSEETLFQKDILPFQTLAHRSPMIMTSHCIFPSLDKKEASLSGYIMKNLLRKKLRYKGVIVTDDMTMGAISKKPEPLEDLITESIAQGADLALVCRGLDNWQKAIDRVNQEAEKSAIFRERLREASGRVRLLSRWLN